MNMMEKLKKVEAFSNDYAALIRSDTIAFKEAKSWERVRENWWYALLFYFDRVYYQGRNDKLSGYFERAAIKALEPVLAGDLTKLKRLRHWLEPEQWNVEGNPLWEALGRTYNIGRDKLYATGTKYDKKMVMDSLRFVLNDCKDCNILEHSIQEIQSGNIAGLSKRLHEIFNVKDKASSFFLRDAVFVYELDAYLKPEDYYLLVPIDVHVSRIVERLGIKADAREIAIVCQQNGVSPVRFNQGAFYFSYFSFDILLDML